MGLLTELDEKKKGFRMTKSEKFDAPTIVGKAKEDRKPYLFKNRKDPGTTVKCFTGECPKDGEWFKDTVTEHNLVDGQVVHLTEAEVKHFKERGIEKGITAEGPGGHRSPTGQSYLDNR